MGKAGVKAARAIKDCQVRGNPDDGKGHLEFLMFDPEKGHDIWVPALHVRYGERGDAWSIVFGDQPMPAWKQAKEALVQATSCGGTVPTFAADPDPTPGPKMAEPKLAPLPSRVTGTIDDMVRTTVEDMVANSQVGVDRAEVVAIVHEVAETLAPNVTQYVFPDREPIVLKEGEAHEVLPEVLDTVAAGEIPWLVGPAGTGKSTIARKVAWLLSLDFAAVGCSVQMSESKLLGYMDMRGEYIRTRFRDCYENGGVFLLDEMDSAHPSVLTAFNDALANGQCAFPDGMIDRHADFVPIVAANTYGRGADREYVGRMQLDAATLDRFFMVEVGYDVKLEAVIAQAHHEVYGAAWLTVIHAIRANAERHRIKCIVSTRAVVKAKMLHRFKAERVLDSGVFRGIDAEQKRKLMEGVSLAGLS